MHAAQRVVVARKAGVIAGLPLVEAAFHRLAPEIEITPHARDGAAVAARHRAHDDRRAGAGAARGRARRAQFPRASLRRRDRAPRHSCSGSQHTQARVTCTRKTIPGLRALQKYAVRCGGGFNHRFGLDDAMLIKDNHIAVAGGIGAVLARARAAAGHLVKIEIEVDSLDQLREVLDVGGADVVLLDNMDPPTLRQAVEMVDRRLVLEASGRDHARDRRRRRRDRRRLPLVRGDHALGVQSGRRARSRHRIACLGRVLCGEPVPIPDQTEEYLFPYPLAKKIAPDLIRKLAPDALRGGPLS